MYCSKCGSKLRDGVRFCPSCGAPVNTVHKREILNKASDKDNIKISSVPEHKKSCLSVVKPKYVAIAALAIVLVGVCSFCGIREVQYRNLVAEAESAFEEAKYLETKELLEKAIELRPGDIENYTLLASTCLEQGNLYGAKTVLEEGYGNTGNDVLRDVTLWGPVPVFEIVIWSDEDIPITRQEYHFDGSESIQGYVSMFGNIVFMVTYHFSNAGENIHVSLTDYVSNVTTIPGINRALWETGWPFDGEPDVEWNYVCDADGRIVSVEYNDNVISIYMSGTDVILGTGSDEIVVRYDDTNRPLEISAEDGGGEWRCSFTYVESGGYFADYSEHDGIFECDTNGLIVALKNDGADDFTLELDDQYRVISCAMSGQLYEYKYLDDGYLDTASILNSDGSAEVINSFSYDEEGQLIEIRQEWASGETDTYQIEYDSSGQMTRFIMSAEDVADVFDYHYTEDGRLEFYTLMSGETQSITVYIPVYDDYGDAISFTRNDALYEPGTYSGAADGFGGPVVVEVTVDYLKITDVEVIEQHETAGFDTKAFEELADEMVETGSPYMDAVTGATISSRAFLEAVEDALVDARIYQDVAPAWILPFYEELEGKTFVHTRGVGNWSAEITFGINGLFQGSFYNFDMGNSTADYPSGTCYFYDFSGTMGNIRQIDENTFSMEIVEFFATPNNGGAGIRDGIRYVETPYDIGYGDTFILYRPGKETEELSEEFLSWLSIPLGWYEAPETLPIYALHGTKNNDGYFCDE